MLFASDLASPGKRREPSNVHVLENYSFNIDERISPNATRVEF